MKIGKELDYILNLQKRKDAKERIIRVYEALLYKKGKNKEWFDCPSTYLQKIHTKYNKVLPLLLEYGIIEYKSINNGIKKKDDIFEPSVFYKKKRYFPTQSIKYRFLIDVEEGYDYKCEVKSNLYDGEKWFVKTKYSLEQLGFEDIRIARDNFSRRLHTNITAYIPEVGSYKDLLGDSIYYTIDSKTSHPRLLWLHLKEIGLQDQNLNYIFENELDFYTYIIDKIPALKSGNDEYDRTNAKELFASWINGTGYLQPEYSTIRNIFPVVNTFIKNYKTSSYKDVCRLLQTKEANIFTDELLNDCPVEFCLSVFDSLIVKEEDKDRVFEWCKEKYPELRFKLEKIKKRN